MNLIQFLATLTFNYGYTCYPDAQHNEAHIHFEYKDHLKHYSDYFGTFYIYDDDDHDDLSVEKDINKKPIKTFSGSNRFTDLEDFLRKEGVIV